MTTEPTLRDRLAADGLRTWRKHYDDESLDRLDHLAVMGTVVDAMMTELKRRLALEPERVLAALDSRFVGWDNQRHAEHDIPALVELPGSRWPINVPCFYCGRTYIEFPQRMERGPALGPPEWAHWGCAADAEVAAQGFDDRPCGPGLE